MKATETTNDPYPRLRQAVNEIVADNLDPEVDDDTIIYDVLGIAPEDYDDTRRWTTATVREISRISGKSVSHLVGESDEADESEFADTLTIDASLQDALGNLFETADGMEDGDAKRQVLKAMKTVEEVKKNLAYEKADMECEKYDLEEAASRAACCLKTVVLILQEEADHAEGRDKTELLYGLSYIVGNAISELERS